MSINAHIITDDGVNGFAFGKPFAASVDHPNYAAIIQAIKANNYAPIPDLVNQSKAMQARVTMECISDRVKIDAAAGVILYDGYEIHNTLVNHIFRSLADGFDINPTVLLLEHMLENPSKQTIERMFDWFEAGNMPITEDGYFIAFKRVRNDWTSFYDSKTMHEIGKETSFPRYLCDDNNHNTCSAGLHFCSQGYLPSYCGGEGRVLVLKIHPKDVVAIPFEYGTHKGRACNYLVLAELQEDMREQVETANPLTTAVVETETAQEIAGATVEYIGGYIEGHKDGKDKATMKYPVLQVGPGYERARGYSDGYKDGRGHKGRKFKPSDLTIQLIP